MIARFSKNLLQKSSQAYPSISTKLATLSLSTIQPKIFHQASLNLTINKQFCTTPEKPSNIITLKDNEHWEQILGNATTPIIVDFTAT